MHRTASIETEQECSQYILGATAAPRVAASTSGASELRLHLEPYLLRAPLLGCRPQRLRLRRRRLGCHPRRHRPRRLRIPFLSQIPRVDCFLA